MGDQDKYDFLPRHKRNMIKTDLKDIHWDTRLNMYVHDVLIPERLEKYYLNPHGIHNKRDEKAKKIDERLQKRMEAKEKEDKLPKYRTSSSTSGPSIRQQRISQLIWEGCQDVIAKDFKQEKLGGFSVNRVRITRNLSYAKLFWNCTPQHYQTVNQFLKKTTKLFRYFLAQRIS